MKFFAIYLPGVHEERVDLLRAAAEKLGVPFRAVSPFRVDFASESPTRAGDIVYRVGRGKLLRAVEKYLLKPGVVTFYKNPDFKRENNAKLVENGIPVPKTIFCTTRSRTKLRAYVEQIGGLPIVVKALGGTRGLGVMKIDTFSSLFSIVDYLLAQGKFFTLREYVQVKTSARFVVLGNKVIAAYEYISQDDFRSNAADIPRVKVKKYPKSLEQIAVKATVVLGLEFGGVDVLVKNGKAFVTEVNFPCNFVRAQKLLKKDVALEIVGYLMKIA